LCSTCFDEPPANLLGVFIKVFRGWAFSRLMGINPKDFRQMKHNVFAILCTATMLLTARVHVTQAVPTPLIIQNPASNTSVLLSQVVNQDAESDRTQPKESGVSIPLVWGVLVILLIAAGIVFWYVRGSAKNQRVEDVRQQIRDVRQAPIIGQQQIEDEPEPEILAQPEDVPEIPILTQQVPDQWEAPISNPVPLELLAKLDTLQQEINTAKQRFQKIGNLLEQEVQAQIQILPESIASQPDSERFLKQQQALSKLDALQAISYDLEFPPEGYFKVGNALFNEQRWEEAIASYDKAIGLNPDSVFAWFNTACIYSLQGDVVRSARYLAQAIHLDPACSAQAEKHAGFDPVRDDEQFKQLLQDG
jgi:TPR repeat